MPHAVFYVLNCFALRKHTHTHFCIFYQRWTLRWYRQFKSFLVEDNEPFIRLSQQLPCLLISVFSIADETTTNHVLVFPDWDNWYHCKVTFLDDSTSAEIDWCIKVMLRSHFWTLFVVIIYHEMRIFRYICTLIWNYVWNSARWV